MSDEKKEIDITDDIWLQYTPGEGIAIRLESYAPIDSTIATAILKAVEQLEGRPMSDEELNAKPMSDLQLDSIDKQTREFLDGGPVLSGTIAIAALQLVTEVRRVRYAMDFVLAELRSVDRDRHLEVLGRLARAERS